MNYWSDIKEGLSDRTEVASQLLLLVLSVYIFIMAENYLIGKVPVLFIGLLCWFLLRHKTKHSILWIIFFVLLLLDLYHFYFRVANHHFMLMFIVLIVGSFSYHKRGDVLQKNIQMLLVVILTASVVQKLMSSQFMSGDFYYYMANRGYLFRNFLNFFPENLEIAKSNSQRILALQDTDPNFAQHIVSNDILPNLGKISLIYVWLTVIVEVVVAIALSWRPKNIWTHLLFLAMIFGILCTRLETGFMALLAICGIMLCSNVKLRLLYAVIVIGCITLIVTKLGYH